jgi:hypothetical protein
MPDKANVKICTSPFLEKVHVAGGIVVTIENCERLPIKNVSIIAESPSDVLKISPKKKILPTVDAGQTVEVQFSASPQTFNMGFAVTVRYNHGNRLYIHTSDHVVQI